MQCCCPFAARYMSAPPRRSTYRTADNSGQLTAERLQEVPRARWWAADRVAGAPPPPAHVAELAVAAAETRPAAASAAK